MTGPCAGRTTQLDARVIGENGVMLELWADAYLIGSKQFSADHARRSSCGAADGVQ